MITVLTSSYKHGKFLQESINSVLNQTYTDFVYHLIDDGSSDETSQIMFETSKKDSRIKMFTLPKQPTTAHILNMSIGMTETKYWCWAHADDVLDTKLLQKKFDLAEKNPNTVVYGYVFDHIDAEGKYIKTEIIEEKTPEEFRQHIKVCCEVTFCGILIPMSVFKIVGNFPNDTVWSEDFLWTLIACKKGIDFIGLR